MNRIFALTGCFCLLIAGFALADSVSSTIVCDGASWVSSSVIGQGQTYAAHLFTTDIASVLRNLQVDTDGTVRTMTTTRASGPIGIDEYSARNLEPTRDPDQCVFTSPENTTLQDARIWYKGLMKAGEYESTREVNQGMYAGTMANGSGILLVRAKSTDENRTMTHSGDIAGTINMSEEILLGGEK